MRTASAARRKDIETLAASAGHGSDQEIAYHPARVLMQDFTGVPAVVDLAAMRDALVRRGVDPQKINPLSPVDLVIDHSVSIDKFATSTAFEQNVALEMQRNHERYQFLKWGQGAFDNFRVVPPGTGICHQVNLEYLAQVVWQQPGADGVLAYPDTLVGTDSHTTMINGLGVLGWGVGGIEAEAAMLGQPISMLLPDVVGFELTGQHARGHYRHRPGVAGGTDAAGARRGGQVCGILRQRAGPAATVRPRHHRQHGARVRGHLRIFPGRCPDAHLPAADRARRTTRSRWWRPTARRRACGATSITSRRILPPRLHLDMSTVEPNLAGPRRPAGPRGRARPASCHRRVHHTGWQSGPVGYSVPARRRHDIPAPRRCGDRGDYLLHQHLQSGGDDRRGTGGAKGAGARPAAQALGKIVTGTRLESRHRLPDQGRPAGLTGCAGFQPGGLRLYHLYRQLRPVAGGGGKSDYG